MGPRAPRRRVIVVPGSDQAKQKAFPRRNETAGLTLDYRRKAEVAERRDLTVQ